MKPSLRAIVDIGSNGIRFSISSVSPNHARIIPCLYLDRAPISLFDDSPQPTETEEDENDGQSSVNTNTGPPAPAPGHTSRSIPKHVVVDVLQSMLRFKNTCADFGVGEEYIDVLATEAVAEAPNGEDFRAMVKETVGWTVQIMSLRDEALYEAYGVASAFFHVNGLYMDLGGGSALISWMVCENGKFSLCRDPVKLPYGAAAITRRLMINREDPTNLYREMEAALKDAVDHITHDESSPLLQTMHKYAKLTGGYKLYVSGGGFRGLGHLLLSQSGQYPLPVINGFSTTGHAIREISQSLKSEVMELYEQSEPPSLATSAQNSASASNTHTPASSPPPQPADLQKIFARKKKNFRISSRRASQIPAVSLFISAAVAAFPRIRKILFSQGGIREGVLFSKMTETIRNLDPVMVATSPYAGLLAPSYAKVLTGCIPSAAPQLITQRLVGALCNTIFVHSSYPKEVQPFIALQVASSGVISGAHGLSHEIRALLGLALCHRWGGDLADKSFYNSLVDIVQPKDLCWWACFCGAIMHVVCGVYPGGNIKGYPFEINVTNVWEAAATNESNASPIPAFGFELTIRASKSHPNLAAPSVRNRINSLGKRMKRLRKEFNGRKVDVVVEWY